MNKNPTGRLTWPPVRLQRLPTSEEAKRIIAAWRAQQPRIVTFWADLERRIP